MILNYINPLKIYKYLFTKKRYKIGDTIFGYYILTGYSFDWEAGIWMVEYDDKDILKDRCEECGCYHGHHSWCME
jgi:hypothetical protein